jgi:hypothetical protein
VHCAIADNDIRGGFADMQTLFSEVNEKANQIISALRETVRSLILRFLTARIKIVSIDVPFLR